MGSSPPASTAALYRAETHSLIGELSARLAVSADRLEHIVRLVRTMTKEGFDVVEGLLEFETSGASSRRRSAVCAGLARALRALGSVPRDDDPLSAVDRGTSLQELAESVLFCELEAQERRQRILERCVSVARASELVGRSRQTIERLRREGRILALRVSNRWRYPEWQFTPDAPGGVVPRLGDVLQLVRLSPAGAACWLTTPSAELGGHSPIELLHRGDAERVLQVAEKQGYMP